jgi:hypothetical protein
MQTTVVQPMDVTSTKAPVTAGWSDFLIGLGLTAVVPAIFWVGLFAGVAGLLGYTPSVHALLIAGVLIAAFLGTFFAVLSAKPKN